MVVEQPGLLGCFVVQLLNCLPEGQELSDRSAQPGTPGSSIGQRFAANVLRLCGPFQWVVLQGFRIARIQTTSSSVSSLLSFSFVTKRRRSMLLIACSKGRVLR